MEGKIDVSVDADNSIMVNNNDASDLKQEVKDQVKDVADSAEDNVVKVSNGDREDNSKSVVSAESLNTDVPVEQNNAMNDLAEAKNDNDDSEEAKTKVDDDLEVKSKPDDLEDSKKKFADVDLNGDGKTVDEAEEAKYATGVVKPDEAVPAELDAEPEMVKQQATEEDVPPPMPDSAPPAEDPPSYDDVAEDEEEKAPSSRSASPEPEVVPEPEPEPEVESEPEPEPEVVPVPQLDAVSEPITHKYHPRLCIIRKWADFQGYGFNLHAEKDRQGQYIGLVDADSPADDANLKKGDRIIEVNGDNIEDVSHQQVIQKIKAGGDETSLLVVDNEADEYYKNNGIKISAYLPEVVMKETTPREAPAMSYFPRLCHLVKWPEFNGYGFNLHAEKERGAQFIGKIDDNSPALAAGLREHDRIIEVNGANIEQETHQQVISRIKAGGDETRLLVVDKDADNYYKSRGVTVHQSMSEVKRMSAERTSAPAVANGDSAPAPQPTRAIEEYEEPVEPIEQIEQIEPIEQVEPIQQQREEEPVRAVQPSKPVEQQQANGGGDLMLNLSAKEMRERLASKRRNDPKQKSNMDFRSKFEIFQKM